MAQTGYTPIQLYYSSTATNTPLASNLLAGELAINTADEKLYFKNSSGTVKLLASSASATGTVSSVALTVPSFLSVSGSPITTSGTLAVTLSGTALPTANGGTGQTTYTDGQLLIGNTLTGSLSKATISAGANVTITNGNGTITIAAASPGTGTVTSVGMSVPAFLSVTPSTITTSGTFAVTLSGTALPTANGGTGLTGFTAANNAIYSTSASALTAGTLPTAAGGTGLTTFTAANNAIYSTSSSALAAGTLPVAAGGTGATSLTSGYLLVGAGTSAVTGLAPGTSGNLVVSNGSTWSSTTSGVTLTTPSITFSTTASVSAAGTTQVTATALTTDYNVVTTVGASSGVVLPTATVGRRIIVVNKGANALAIYPASGAAIDALAANTAISLAVGGVLEFNASSTTQWYSTTNTAINAAQLTGTVATANGGTGLTGFGAANNAIYSTSSTALAAGTLPVAAGGTGATSLTANYALLGNGTSALQGVAPGASGNVLTSNGTTWTSSAPTGGGVTSITFGTTGLTPNTATTGAVTVAGTLAVGNGGTGSTTLTANSVILGNGTSALSSNLVAPSTAANALISNGTTWASVPFSTTLYIGTASGSISALAPVSYTNSTGTTVSLASGTNPAVATAYQSINTSSNSGSAPLAGYDDQALLVANSAGTTVLAVYVQSPGQSAGQTVMGVKAGTISGTSVTWGTAQTIGLGTNTTNHSMALSYDITNAKWVLFLCYGTSSNVRSISVSGTTVTLNASASSSLTANVTVSSGAWGIPALSYDVAQSKTLLTWFNSSYYPACQVITLSGTTTSLGTAVVIESVAAFAGSGNSASSAYDSTSAKHFIGYNGSSFYKVVMATISGTSATFGSIYTTTFAIDIRGGGSALQTQNSSFPCVVVATSISRYCLFCGNNGVSFGAAAFFTLSGTTLSLASTFNGGGSNPSTVTPAKPTNGYWDSTNNIFVFADSGSFTVCLYNSSTTTLANVTGSFNYQVGLLSSGYNTAGFSSIVPLSGKNYLILTMADLGSGCPASYNYNLNQGAFTIGVGGGAMSGFAVTSATNGQTVLVMNLGSKGLYPSSGLTYGTTYGIDYTGAIVTSSSTNLYKTIGSAVNPNQIILN